MPDAPIDPLVDFSTSAFSHGGRARTVYELGSGPAVIVIAEMPGITPQVIEFARRIAAIGCTAVVPHLFGEPGKSMSPTALLESFVPACVSREFTVFATGRTSPIVDWLRALARDAHARCGGPGVGAVGMCFTGGYALAMATDDRILAPILSQPSLPLPVTRRQRSSIDISATDLAVVKGRCAAGLEVIGLRFEGDRFVPAARFEFLRRELGDAFIAIELPADAARAESKAPPHSVLTEHLVDREGTPTRDALDRVLDHLRTRLQVGD